MAKTNVQRNAAYYERLMKEAEKSSFAPHYQAVCTALKKLMQFSNQVNDPDRQMTSKEYETLTKHYKEVQDACSRYLANKEDFEEFEKLRGGIIADISSVADKDMGVLLQCDPFNPGTLSEIMDKARTRKIVLDEKAIKNVGGAMSSRTPMSTNSGRKGFFTPKSVFNLDEKWRKQIEKFEEKFNGVSEDLKKNLERLKSNEEFQNTFSFFNPELPISRENRNKPEVKSIMNSLARVLGMGKTTSEIKTLFSKTPGLYDTLVDFSNALCPVTRQQGILATAGMKKGDNLSSRNCAMSNVAKLLGCHNLIANSIPMKVQIGNKEVEGVFMEAAQGSDINNLKDDDLLMQAKEDSFLTKEAVGQLSDLQVLDFICGNTDRHMGNLFYKLGKTPSGDIKLMGIQGIDNDCAFGRIKTAPGKHFMRMVNPEDMRYISESMAAKLGHIEKSMLELKLAHNDLSKQEIDGVLERFQIIKTAVQKNKIKVINEDYWKKHKLVVKETENSYLSYMPKLGNLCKKKYFERDTVPRNTITYAQETYTANEIMLENEKRIEELKDKMNKARARFFNSSEYDIMAKRFEKIATLTREMRQNYPGLKNVPERLTNELRNTYIDMQEKTDRYISLKKLVPYSERGQKRVDFAKELLKMSEETLDKLGIKFEKEDKTNRTPEIKDDQMEL